MPTNKQTLENLEEEHEEFLSVLKEYAKTIGNENDDDIQFIESLEKDILQDIEKLIGYVATERRILSNDTNSDLGNLDEKLDDFETGLKDLSDSVDNQESEDEIKAKLSTVKSDWNALQKEVEDKNYTDIKDEDKWQEGMGDLVEVTEELIFQLSDQPNTGLEMEIEIEDFKNRLWINPMSRVANDYFNPMKKTLDRMIDGLKGYQEPEEMLKEIKTLEEEIENALEWHKTWKNR